MKALSNMCVPLQPLEYWCHAHGAQAMLAPLDVRPAMCVAETCRFRTRGGDWTVENEEVVVELS